MPEVEFEWKIPQWSNAIERDRARTYFQAYAAAAALHFAEKAMKELHAGRTKTWEEFTVPENAIGCGFHEAVRGVLSHHVVIRDGKIANYHPYPPTPWNASPRDVFGTPGPYEDAVQNTPIFEENGPDKFKGIDIMHAVPVSIRVCRAACICTTAAANCSMSSMCRCSACSRGEVETGETMTYSLDGREFQERLQRLEVLLQEVERGRMRRRRNAYPRDRAGHSRSARRGTRTNARPDGGTCSPGMRRRWRVAGMLLLHGLHPLDLKARVQQALEEVRPRAADARRQCRIAASADGVVRLRLEGNCHGCPSSAATMRQTVEEAIVGKSPMYWPWRSRAWWRSAGEWSSDIRFAHGVNKMK